jgi:dolichol-phosphate mannosyltransferase
VRQAFADRGWAVPAFRAQALRPRATRHVVVIPVINEGPRIQRQLRDMAALGLPAAIDTVVVDGGSSDGSVDPDALASLGVRALLTKTGPGRLSAQLRCAYAWALLEGYDGVITIDGNNKDGVETLPRFSEALDQGFDYVQASRFLPGGRAENTPLARLLAIRLIHAPALSWAAGVRLTDTTQGYRAYSSAYLLDPRTQPFRDVFQRYELLAYLTVRASQLGYRVTELPTTRVYPRDEAVPTKIASLGALVDLLVVVWRTLRGAYNPADPADPAQGGAP